MIDGARLQTPSQDGGVLVLPEPARLLRLARDNHRDLSSASATILGRPIAAWRREVREQLVGTNDVLVVVTGHQPSLPHPGVWAKQVVARRLAEACDGAARSLVIDSDEIDVGALPIPSARDGGVILHHVPLPAREDASVFEQMRAWTTGELRSFEGAVESVMSDGYHRSLLPCFVTALRTTEPSLDGVDQRLRSLEAIDRMFSADVPTVRISRAPVFALLADMAINAERFAHAYNRALAWYRTTFGVRGARRPIPDLAVDARRCEIAAWAYRATGPRRRVFVAPNADNIRVFAGDVCIGALSTTHLRNHPESLAEIDGWRLRPRALATTAWARLLLADLFIHGIGGAKYDRVTDRILADYYGVASNEVACVSATLWLDLPRTGVRADDVRKHRRSTRDWMYNPQRLAHAQSEIPEALLRRRDAALRTALVLRERSPRDHAARRAAFNEIRDANAAIRDAIPWEGEAARQHLRDAEAAYARDRIATGREYFIGLYEPAAIERLIQKLPRREAFVE